MITQKELKHNYKYDETTGIFYRKLRDKRSIKKYGSKYIQTGTLKSNGYIELWCINKVYKAHRLAWLYVYGEWPSKAIDHINRNRSDNRICNLRDVSIGDNNKNCKMNDNNTSGTKGVVWRKDTCKWNARIGVGGKQVSLGYFIEYHEAVNARKNAEVLYGYIGE